MTPDEQISILNREVKCAIGVSNIHGVGVIALLDILKGERLYTMRDYDEVPRWYTVPLDKFEFIRPEVRALILDRWAQPPGGRPFQSPNDDANLMSFMNHSENPNSKYGYAERDIKKGEEVTENYRDLGARLSTLSMRHYDFL